MSLEALWLLVFNLLTQVYERQNKPAEDIRTVSYYTVFLASAINDPLLRSHFRLSVSVGIRLSVCNS